MAQREGFPVVRLKSDAGEFVAELENGLTVNIVEQDIERVKVSYGARVGWGQKYKLGLFCRVFFSLTNSVVLVY